MESALRVVQEFALVGIDFPLLVVDLSPQAEIPCCGRCELFVLRCNNACIRKEKISQLVLSGMKVAEWRAHKMCGL
jgi:hypothetical protein